MALPEVMLASSGPLRRVVVQLRGTLSDTPAAGSTSMRKPSGRAGRSGAISRGRDPPQPASESSTATATSPQRHPTWRRRLLLARAAMFTVDGEASAAPSAPLSAGVRVEVDLAQALAR